MISVIFLVITISIFVCGQGNNHNVITITTEPAAFFETQSYRDKICKSEPTCHMINDATPKEYTALDYRNCMCDVDCRRYGDCCLDSKHYNATEQKQNYQNFHCSFQETVYMITSCPKSYTNASIRTKCEKSTLPLDKDDIKLIIPVTNVNTRITYGNEYCAQCHGEKNYRLWNETRYCSVKETESIRPDDFQQNYPVANLDNDTSSSGSKLPQYYRVENFTDLTENDTLLPQTNDLSEQSVEATKYIKFNSTSKTFYSSYNNRQFSCFVGRVIPEDLNLAVRRCRIVASECADVSNKTLIEKCRSYTSIVFDNFGSYRNKDCAVCNGVTKTLPGCFSSSTEVSHAAASNLFSTKNKIASEINPCADPTLKDKFCK